MQRQMATINVFCVPLNWVRIWRAHERTVRTTRRETLKIKESTDNCIENWFETCPSIGTVARTQTMNRPCAVVRRTHTTPTSTCAYLCTAHCRAFYEADDDDVTSRELILEEIFIAEYWKCIPKWVGQWSSPSHRASCVWMHYFFGSLGFSI